MKKIVLSVLTICLFLILIYFYQDSFNNPNIVTTTKKIEDKQLSYGLSEIGEAFNEFKSISILSSEFKKNKEGLELEEKEGGLVYTSDIANIGINLEKTLFENDKNLNFGLDSEDNVVALFNGSQSGKDVALIVVFSKDDYMCVQQKDKEIKVGDNVFRCSEDWGNDYTYTASCIINKDNWCYNFEYVSYADKENVISVEDILLNKIYFLK